MRIEWSAVAGARGYGVQWERVESAQDVASAPAERTVQTTSVELRLSPGVYRIRVSALNRFGKAGGWSDWIDFRVEDTAVKQTLDLNRPKPVEPVPAPRPVASRSLLHWKTAVPGLWQIESGRPSGWAYPALLAGIVGFGVQAKLRGDRIAADPWNDPAFSGAVALSFASAGGAGAIPGAGNDVAAFLSLRRGAQRDRYDALQRDQRIAGYAALLLFAVHGAEVLRMHLSGSRSALVVKEGAVAIETRF